MSWWTEVFLATSMLEDEGYNDRPHFPTIDEINASMEFAPNGLFLILHPDTNHHCPNACFVDQFKSLDVNWFVTSLKTAAWCWPEQVQLFLRTEDDRGFQEIKLWEIAVGEPE